MKITAKKPDNTVTFKTTGATQKDRSAYSWWRAGSKRELCQQLLDTAAYLKEAQNYRYKQAATYARLYGNQSLFSFIGSNMNKMDQLAGLPTDRPTFNLVQSCVDTLVSKISQNRPSPVFLTDNSDYKQRSLAKKLNNFVGGEFYQTKTYEKTATQLRDALVEGTGCLKVFEGADDKVGVERVLLTELLIDPNESVYGDPRQLYQLKLVDRAVLKDAFPEYGKAIDDAERATVDGSADSNKSVADLVIVVEGWHLKSGKDATDGRHTIACSSGIIYDDKGWDKDRFPFVFLHYSPRLLGFWSQGLAEQLMGTQLEINALLYTISRAIKLVGVPRIFVEDGSKVVNSHFNSDIGTIIKYQGTMPEFKVAPCVPEELYAQLQRLINYGFQQSGVSALDASSSKPAGLNSGEAIRTYDDISNDRFAALSKRYDNVFVDLSYLIVDAAKSIAERTGSYQTVYPSKDGTKQIDLPKADLIDDPFVIQCFNMSSLPRDPAGRMQKVAEMITSGMITIKEGRRLLDFPDLGQIEKLANAGEERIHQYLDKIVEEGEYTQPDPFLDLRLASDTVVAYINLYVAAQLEEDRAEMLRTWYTQVQSLMQTASTPPPGALPPGAPLPTGAAPGAIAQQGGVPPAPVNAPPAQNGIESEQ